MSDQELERLRKAMAGDPKPTPFVGAGFSAAVTADAQCATWLGLLRNGIDICKEKCPDFPIDRDRWLKEGLENADADGYLTIADEISRRLRPIGDGREFRSWLENTVGSLDPTPHGKKLVGAVRKLGKIVVTTNYDTLIERLDPEWCSYSWGGVGYERSDLTEHSVVHLHGIFNKPDCVVLGTADYAQLGGDELNGILSKGLFVRHRFIFIGCGLGLVDPHIGPIIKFIDRVMPRNSDEHFILMKNGEVRQYRRKPLSAKITPVGYGDEYQDLLPFLEGLAPEQEAAPNGNPPAAGQRVAGGAGSGMLAQVKVAEQKLQDALGVLGRVAAAVREVQRGAGPGTGDAGRLGLRAAGSRTRAACGGAVGPGAGS